MKVIKKENPDGTFHMKAVASIEEVGRALDAAQEVFCQQMGVMPVPGSSAAQAAAEQLGIKDLDAIVAAQAVEYLVPMAFEKHGVIPAFMPQVRAAVPMHREKAFEFEFEATPKPVYELSGYDPVSITVEPYGSVDDEVEAQLQQIAENFSTFEPAEAAVIEQGMTVFLAVRCLIDGKEVPGVTTPGRSYQVGTGMMPPSFDEGIVGMNVGEQRSFSFLAPDIDAEGGLSEKEYRAEVTYLENQKRVKAEITDEFVTYTFPMYSSVEQLRASIFDDLDGKRRTGYEEYKRNLAADELGKRFEGRIADEVYEGTMRNTVMNMRAEIQQQGMRWEDFVTQNGGAQQVNMMLMMQVRSMLVQGYALDALYRHERLSYTDEDVMDVCRAFNPADPALARRRMEEMGHSLTLKESAERLCANKWLVAHADIRVADEQGASAEGE